MIPYEELHRALARWKARSQAGVPEVVRPAVPAEGPGEEVMEATPLPIPAEELGSIPDLAAPQAEIDANELDTYDEK